VDKINKVVGAGGDGSYTRDYFECWVGFGSIRLGNIGSEKV
jgi:hypothetical protein